MWAYVPGGEYWQPHLKWKVKVQTYMPSLGRCSFDSLRYCNDTMESAKQIQFDLGHHSVTRVPVIGIEAINLQFDYKLERLILEKICELSDAGYNIIASKNIILEKNKGSEVLIGIDLDAPTYSHLDDPMQLPF